MAITDVCIPLAVFSHTIVVVNGCVTQPMKLLLTVRNVCQPSVFGKMFKCFKVTLLHTPANLPNQYSSLCWRPVTHAQTWASDSALYRFGRLSHTPIPTHMPTQYHCHSVIEQMQCAAGCCSTELIAEMAQWW